MKETIGNERDKPNQHTRFELHKQQMKNSSNVLCFLFFFFLYFQMPQGFAKLARADEDNSLNTTVEFHVGVILDMERWVGKISYSCMSMALDDFYAAYGNYRTRLVFHPRDSKMDVVTAASAAMELMRNLDVQAIIGPEKSAHAEFIIDLGEKAQVPVMSFSATNPSLCSRSPYFIQTTPGDHTQVKAIASIAHAFGWRKVILIHENTDYGNRLIPYLIHAFQEVNTLVPYRSVISPSATDDRILEELLKLMTMKTSIFVVHVSSSLGSRLFLKAKEAGLMSEGYGWITTDGVMNELKYMNSSVIDSMQGVLGVSLYLPQTEQLNNFIERWKMKFLQENPEIKSAYINNFGLWAYDTVWALAMAAERVHDMESHILKPRSNANSLDILSLRVSETGPELLEEIIKTEFEGLCGDFHLVNRQLQPSAFQILNVVDNSTKEVGYWTQTHGISRDLNLGSVNLYSTSKANFRSIIWPGDSTIEPNGWLMCGETLRIGVPVRDSYTEFVKVERDTHTNSTKVSGYCIEVFESVIASLPHSIPYEFVPFQNPDGESTINYNDLIYQVYLKKFDAVVADTTITANRSLYVDFAIPYTDGGLWMIVLTKSEQIKNKWIFFNPPKYLWLSSVIFIIVTSFMMRRSNVSNHHTSGKWGGIFSKLVVILWFSLLFMITSVYVAKLTLMLTNYRFQPSITDFKDLISKGDYVGYHKSSFVGEFLKRSNFDESKLKAYNTPEECNEALLRGSHNDGITAFFDELPYINIFLSKYCSKYTTVGPTHKTDGFGFVFPRGSPIVADISKAVLNVTEGKKMMEIQRAWFPQQSFCNDDNHEFIINSFVMTGIFSMLFLVFSDKVSRKRSRFQPSRTSQNPIVESQSPSSSFKSKDEIQSNSEVEAECPLDEASRQSHKKQR